MQNWEYKVVQVYEEEQTKIDLNALGSDGWELTAAVSTGYDNHYAYLYFKRPKS